MPADSDQRVRAKSGRRIVGWLIKAAFFVAILWLGFILAEGVLRRVAIAQIAELTNTQVRTDSVNLSTDGSILIKNLAISPRQESGYDDTILKAGTAYARFGIGSLLLLRPRLKEIRVKDFVFNAQHDLDTDRWNVGTLRIRAPKGTSGKMPLLQLEGGTLQYSKILKGQTKIVAEVPLHARFGFDEKTQDGYRFEITTAEWKHFAKSVMRGFWEPGTITIAGGISSADVPTLEMAWIIDVFAAELTYDESNNYSLKLNIRNLVNRYRSSGDASVFGESLFLKRFGAITALQRFFSRYRPQGNVDIDFEASGNLKQLAASGFRGKVYCRGISICDRNFPYVVDQIAGEVDFTEKSVSLNNLRGDHGDVRLFFNGWSRDFGPNGQYQIQITSDNMALDNELYKALGPKRKKLWSAFSPSGVAAIHYCLTRQPQVGKQGTLAVELLGVEAEYREFPYPLENLTGTLLLDADSITAWDVVSRLNEQKITLNGKVTGCGGDRPICDILIEAENVPLDSTLAAALPARQRRFYDYFGIAGLADAQIRVFTPQQNGSPASFAADVYFKETTLRAKQSQLTVSDISGQARFEPDSISIENFEGKFGSGSVSLTGRIWLPEKAEQLRYHLAVQARDGELNDNLFSLLPTSLKTVMSGLQPKGTMSYRVDINGGGTDDDPDYKVVVDCFGGSINFGAFPYPLKDVRGGLTITRDCVTLDDITATAADNIQITPNTSAVKISGQITLANNAFSRGRLQLSATDIFFDERLGIALPEALRTYYRKLSPTGRFDLNFENIGIAETVNGAKSIDFAGTLRFKDCNFNVSPAITEFNGLLTTKGLFNTGDGFHRGQAALIADKLRIKGKSLSELVADIYYDDSRRKWLTRKLVADCYDGRLTGRFELKRPTDKALEYLLEAGFEHIDLRRFLQDGGPKEAFGRGDTRGKMCGSLCVTGRSGDNHSRFGRCRLQITDMQVGKLSPLAKLLEVLKLTEPRDYAFDRMLVDSYINHNSLFFEHVDLSGESLAFTGCGWMNLQNDNINLALTARGPRLATAEPTLWGSLTEGLGGAVVRMDVTGSFYDPQVTTTALPVIKDALGIWGTKPTEPD